MRARFNGLGLFVSLVVISTSGCKLAGFAKAGTTSTTKDVESPSDEVATDVEPTETAEAPEREEARDARSGSSADDPPETREMFKRLTAAERVVEQRDFEKYRSAMAWLNYSFHTDPDYAKVPKRAQIASRLKALEVKAVAIVGGNVAKYFGDGTRVTKHKGDNAREAMDRALDACDAASNSRNMTRVDLLTDALARYDEAIARAVRVDPSIVRFIGTWDTLQEDVATHLIECESRINTIRLDIEDMYVEEVSKSVNKQRGCGAEDFLIDGVQLGPNKFAPYTETLGTATGIHPIACNKIPTKTNAPELARFADGNKDIIVMKVGKPFFKTAGDFKVHRFQRVSHYSRKFVLDENPCGPDAKLFCEAGGSKGGAAFNRIEHAIERAELHAGVRPDRCKQHLANAFKEWEWFRDFRAEMKRDGQWIEGATYKTKRGALLPEAKFVVRFEQLGKLADDRTLDDYCQKAQRSPKQSGKPGTRK